MLKERSNQKISNEIITELITSNLGILTHFWLPGHWESDAHLKIHNGKTVSPGSYFTGGGHEPGFVWIPNSFWQYTHIKRMVNIKKEYFVNKVMLTRKLIFFRIHLSII